MSGYSKALYKLVRMPDKIRKSAQRLYPTGEKPPDDQSFTADTVSNRFPVVWRPGLVERHLRISNAVWLTVEQ
jgi:hypothetical protein